MITIEQQSLFLSSANNGTFFHPKAALNPETGELLMTLQTIHGSDHYGPLQVGFSRDRGNSWTAFRNIDPMGIEPIGDGIEEGVCDVVPDYHAATGKFVAIGHNVFYKNGRFLDTLGFFYPKDKSSLQRRSVYSIRQADGTWSTRRFIGFDEFKDYSAMVCGCSQKVFLPDGKMIIPFVICQPDRRNCQVCSVLCRFDGWEITPEKRGGLLELRQERGLLEPSLVEFQGTYYMTLRAEDRHGYLTISPDGLNWAPISPWYWDDGEPLVTGSTQQHWLRLKEKLYLVYTRQTEYNRSIIRWRSPLFLAEVIPNTLCLKRDSEQLVFPMRGNPDRSETVPLMGNFMPLALSKDEAIITEGDILPANYSGKGLLTRLKA